MIRPVIRLQPRQAEQFADAIRSQARQAARAELDEIGTAWVDEVVKIVSDELPRRGPPRHRENTTHLDESFQHRIVEGPNDGFPMRLELTTKPGVRAAKVGALEFGIDREYEITARNTKALRWGDAPGDLRAPNQKSVTWKPTGRIKQGYRFMERARDRVLTRRRR